MPSLPSKLPSNRINVDQFDVSKLTASMATSWYNQMKIQKTKVLGKGGHGKVVLVCPPTQTDGRKRVQTCYVFKCEPYRPGLQESFAGMQRKTQMAGELAAQVYSGTRFTVGNGEMFGTVAEYVKGASWSVELSMERFQLFFDSIQALHSLGVAHGDLNPENVLFVTGSHNREQVKFIDFGNWEHRPPLYDYVTLLYYNRWYPPAYVEEALSILKVQSATTGAARTSQTLAYGDIRIWCNALDSNLSREKRRQYLEPVVAQLERRNPDWCKKFRTKFSRGGSTQQDLLEYLTKERTRVMEVFATGTLLGELLYFDS